MHTAKPCPTTSKALCLGRVSLRTHYCLSLEPDRTFSTNTAARCALQWADPPSLSLAIHAQATRRLILLSARRSSAGQQGKAMNRPFKTLTLSQEKDDKVGHMATAWLLQ